MRLKSVLLASIVACYSVPAMAGPGDPVEIAEGVTLDPQVNLRVRYENVDQDNALGTADALTARLRAGVEVKSGNLSFLADGEGTLALVDDYNDTLPGNGVEPFSVVADPENIELNRLQVSYMKDANGLTVGRQRIILDNARFVGNVGWRQNEQTFDAARAMASVGPVKLDATYSISQRTIFGTDSPNAYFDGDFVFLNAGLDTEIVTGAAFAYLLDYDNRLAFSSDTYGLWAQVKIPAGDLGLTARASFATQDDAGANPVNYSAEYYHFELGASVAGFALAGGYEELGSDGGIAAFQTPMATLHAFNGWADLFLVTPASGLRDYYAKVSKGFTLPGLGAVTGAVVYHEFDSDFGSLDYGSEIDASLGFKVGQVGILAKYANFNSDGFAVDTEKFWLQAEIAF